MDAYGLEKAETERYEAFDFEMGDILEPPAVFFHRFYPRTIFVNLLEKNGNSCNRQWHMISKGAYYPMYALYPFSDFEDEWALDINRRQSEGRRISFENDFRVNKTLMRLDEQKNWVYDTRSHRFDENNKLLCLPIERDSRIQVDYMRMANWDTRNVLKESIWALHFHWFWLRHRDKR